MPRRGAHRAGRPAPVRQRTRGGAHLGPLDLAPRYGGELQGHGDADAPAADGHDERVDRPRPVRLHGPRSLPRPHRHARAECVPVSARAAAHAGVVEGGAPRGDPAVRLGGARALLGRLAHASDRQPAARGHPPVHQLLRRGVGNVLCLRGVAARHGQHAPGARPLYRREPARRADDRLLLRARQHRGMERGRRQLDARLRGAHAARRRAGPLARGAPRQLLRPAPRSGARGRRDPLLPPLPRGPRRDDCAPRQSR